MFNTKWKWKLERWRNSFSSLFKKTANQYAKTRVRVCPNCGVLVDQSDTRCPNCNVMMASMSMPGVRLWFRRNVQIEGLATWSIIILNLLFFLLTWGFTQDRSSLLMGIDLSVLARFGAKVTPLILKGETWRLITAIFLHANLLHIFFNMWVLLDLGRFVEELYGWDRFLFFYVFSGMFGYIASCFVYPDVPSLGASGAIMGLAGVLLADSLKNLNTYGKRLGKGILRWLLYVFLILFLMGGHVDHAAHVGGLVSGFVLALILPSGAPRNLFVKALCTAVGWLSVLVLAWSFGSMLLHQG